MQLGLLAVMPLYSASPENLDGMRRAAALLATWDADAQAPAGSTSEASAAMAEATGIRPDATWEEYREGMQRIVIGLLTCPGT